MPANHTIQPCQASNRGSRMHRFSLPIFLSCRRCFSRFVIITLCLGLTGQRLAAQESKPAHPLDPLSKGEIALAVEVLNANGKTNRDSRFPMIALHEPPKAEVLGFNPGAAMRREAFVVVY